LDLVFDLNYFSFSHPNPNPNPIHLPKSESLSPYHQFYQRIWYVEYYSICGILLSYNITLYTVWSQKFCKSEICLRR